VFKPRPKQQDVLAYRSGKMGVSAVPGSGKTQTLSYLVAELIAQGKLDDGQEVLVVTLVNSAVDNFSSRVAAFVKERGLLPNVNYRVRTLHGLAHDIVRERPALAGLADDFQIVDGFAAQDIIRLSATAWIQGHPHLLDRYLRADLSDYQAGRAQQSFGSTLQSLAETFIQQAKDLRLTPQALHMRLKNLDSEDALLEMCTSIFDDYQNALRYRGAVDFNDLIIKALDALRADPSYLIRLQGRWPYILEDEAQDSSRLQESILRLLSGDHGNWVRMGDPNQAIFETFTTASPAYLRSFLEEEGVTARTLPNSGRSSRDIIQLANRLIDWSMNEHPAHAVRGALTPPYIEPTPPGDPQPNPHAVPGSVRLIGTAYTPDEELVDVARSVGAWIQEHPDQTVAVLVPSNYRGSQLASLFADRAIPYMELLRSTVDTRQTAGSLTRVLDHLADPVSPRKLGRVYEVFRRDDREEETESIQQVKKELERNSFVERFLWPAAGSDWMQGDGAVRLNTSQRESLISFRERVQRWHRAFSLPIDQLLLTIAQDIFHEPVDLALAYRLAISLRSRGDLHPGWTIANFRDELAEIARNRRAFQGFSAEDLGFNPDLHPGKVVITTAHKAKGLEWDRVYIVSVNSYDYPSAIPGEDYLSEKWFLKDGFNIEAEVLARLNQLVDPDVHPEGQRRKASIQAREEYAAERLRLLYVGITRARRELVMTWNTGRRGDQNQALPFAALQDYWEEQHAAS